MPIFNVHAKKWRGGTLTATICVDRRPNTDAELTILLASEIYRLHKVMVTEVVVEKITSVSP